METSALDVFKYLNHESVRPMPHAASEFGQFWLALTNEERNQYKQEVQALTAPPQGK